MVTLTGLWMPILLSAVLVFVASFLSWSVLPFHRNDFRALPDEPGLAGALRRQTLVPAQYLIPHPGETRNMKDPEYVKRMQDGPVAILTMIEPGPPNISKNLAQWFTYVLVVTVFVAYLASRTVAQGAD